MILTPVQQRKIEDDLGLNISFIKGQDKTVRNCWHFSTDGNAVDVLFADSDEFRDAMNRIYVTVKDYNVIILAFALMDTHVHFVLHGEFDECNRFMHEYIWRTSRYISNVRGERHKLRTVPINHQTIDTDSYLKTVICYTVRNAPVGGIPFNAYDYPWSSGPLYLREAGLWSSPRWMSEAIQTRMSAGESKKSLRVRHADEAPVKMIDGIVFPGEYVAFEVVERLFKSHRAYLFFIGRNREEDVDARGGTISHLSIPIQEMRQHRAELCKELFGKSSVRYLDTSQRLRLAKTLKARYNSSIKQIARLSGLVFSEVKDLI